MSIKLELGKTYVTRDGQQVTILRTLISDTPHKWWGSNDLSYTDDGRFYDENNPYRFDLIAEAFDDNTKIVRTGVDMTLRDYFAAKAMQGFLTNIGVVGGHTFSDEDISCYSYDMADAMLRARGES